jgi:hypothetical protein
MNDRYNFYKITVVEKNLLFSRFESSDDKIDFEKYYVQLAKNEFSGLYHCLITVKRVNNKYLIKAGDALKDFISLIKNIRKDETN